MDERLKKLRKEISDEQLMEAAKARFKEAKTRAAEGLRWAAEEADAGGYGLPCAMETVQGRIDALYEARKVFELACRQRAS